MIGEYYSGGNGQMMSVSNLTSILFFSANVYLRISGGGACPVSSVGRGIR